MAWDYMDKIANVKFVSGEVNYGVFFRSEVRDFRLCIISQFGRSKFVTDGLTSSIEY